MNTVKLPLTCLSQEDGGCRLGLCWVQISDFHCMRVGSGKVFKCICLFLFSRIFERRTLINA